MSDQVLYPRCSVVIKAVVRVGTEDVEIETETIPHHQTVAHHSHTKASEAKTVIEGSVLPWPPNHLGNAFVSVFMGLADSVTGSVRVASNLRFCGYFEEYEIDDEERKISFDARDLSQYLREHKPLLTKIFPDGTKIDPTPRYSDTLEQAINRIFSVVPGYDGLDKDGGEIEPILSIASDPNDPFPSEPLSKLVAGRAKTGRIALTTHCSAWEAIEQVCALVNRYPRIELRTLVPRSGKGMFANDDKASVSFVFGTELGNVFGPKRHKKFVRNRKGIKVTAWNPETRKVMTALYPDDATMRTSYAAHRPTPASATKKKPSTKPKKPPKEPDRDVVDLGATIFDQAQLVEKAKDIWLQRATQELDGTVATPIWDVEGKVLALKNGDRVTLAIHPKLEAELRARRDDFTAAQFLKDQLGMSEDAANALAQLSFRESTDNLYYVRTVTHEWPAEKLTTVGFINLMRI